MNYNGLEIDMLSLGDADCILVSQWAGDDVCRVLIDAGKAKHSAQILTKLLLLNVKKIDHLVCSHWDTDHAGGMVEFIADARIEIGEFWMHMPWKHVDIKEVEASLEKVAMKTVIASLNTANALHAAAIARKLTPQEPFTGKTIGFLEVLGPDEKFYVEQVESFRDVEKVKEMARAEYSEAWAADQFTLNGVKLAETKVKLGQPATGAENESSTVLRATHDGKSILFTADAGVKALSRVRQSFPDLAGCKWMQMPHHGSNRNITEELIAFFAPERTFVSAQGDEKHPRREVVDAFKNANSAVYSTHHPAPGDLRQSFGNIPPREGLIPATPL